MFEETSVHIHNSNELVLYRQLEMWRSHVDARHNWWGYNETLAVAGRIRDRGDSPELLQVDYQPFHMNNKSVLSGIKCPPAWDLVGDTCYILIGAPMDFYSARDFCRVSYSIRYVRHFSVSRV